MIIIIKKDGQIVTDDGNPIEGKALEGAYMLLADAQDGDSIVYDSTNHMWKAGQGGGSFAPDITDPQDGDTLVYNATQQKWVNGAGSSGGGVLRCTVNPGTGALDKTWQEIYDAGFAVILFTPNIEEPDNHYILFTDTISIDGSTFMVQFFNPEVGDPMVFASDSADGVLVYQS